MSRFPIAVYEDSGWQRLLPLVYVRPVFQLLCGMGDLLSKVQAAAAGASEPDRTAATGTTASEDGRPLDVWCRPVLADIVAEHTGLPTNRPLAEPHLLLNGRGLWSRLPSVDTSETSWVGTAGASERVACLFADARLMERLSPDVLLDEAQTRAALSGLPRRDVGAHVRLFDWPWEVVLANEHALVCDWEQQGVRRKRLDGRIAEGAYLLAPEAIHIGSGTRIKPCVVIDAEAGPVWIGDNVTILPHSYVQGPAFIGDGGLLQPGAVVHAGTTIGPGCKIGGEVEASIIHSFSNKQHDGFLGHSYVGSWVNIAADCINSDLKNTYGAVRVPINGRNVDTGEMFVGMFVGDHSKTGINVSFPTGSVIGFCSSVFAPRSPKFVPSFAWIDDHAAARYDEHRGIALARKVMARRGKSLTPAEERNFLAIRTQAMAIENQSHWPLERKLRDES